MTAHDNHLALEGVSHEPRNIEGKHRAHRDTWREGNREQDQDSIHPSTVQSVNDLHYHLLTIKDCKTVKVQQFDTRDEAIHEQSRLNAKSPLRFTVPARYCVGNCPEPEA